MLGINEYFEGKVKSISFQGNDSPATIGVISPGEYEFSTSKKEIMTVISGILEVQLKDETSFKKYQKNETFSISAGEKFKVRSTENVAYLCLYY